MSSSNHFVHEPKLKVEEGGEDDCLEQQVEEGRIVTNMNTNMTTKTPKSTTLDDDEVINDEDEGEDEKITSRRNKEATINTHAASFLLFGKRSLYWAWLIFGVGAAAGIAFLWTGIHSARSDQSIQFSQQADQLTQSVATAWNEFSITSLWMHNTCRGDEKTAQHVPTPARSIGCTRHDFDVFFEYISRSGLSFQAVFWTSNVTHQERQGLEDASREYYNTNYPNLLFCLNSL